MDSTLFFGVPKPIIGMCHLRAMPGDPHYDKQGGMHEVVKAARLDLNALQEGGVDAILFSNEFSLPYLTKSHMETVASMARVLGELMAEIKVPFGVDVLWDPMASISLAAATGAKFVREVFTGVYAGDFGLWNTNCGEVVRYQHSIGADSVRLFFNIVPEAAQYLAQRDVEQTAKSTVFNTRPDALCVSGLTAGRETDIQMLKIVKDAVPGVPVFANTGVRLENIESQLSIADGAIVGTTFKAGGVFSNPVDVERVRKIMDRVRQIRRAGVAQRG
ncbi:MAG: BtpA/SgcQ family protein [Ignavibacteriales bacterium]